MIIVTGGAGFIGSNLVKALNKIGRRDILVVDDMTDGTKFRNIVDCEIFDYLDREKLINKIINEKVFGEKIDVIFHLGACSDTTEWDGNYLLSNNYEYSKILFHYCLAEHIPFIYASSAAVYGISKNFSEDPANEMPINAYGYSKLLFDQHVRRFLPNPKSQVVGLRYFNVYGPREQHKGKMASVMLHLNKQIQQTGQLKLFEGTDGYSNGEQLRDFVYVEDVVNVNLWFWKAANKSGIYNVGTGKAATYNAVARAIINFYKKGEITYIPFPDGLRNSYQSFTQADITKLRQIGYNAEFKDINAGINSYLSWMQKI